jgi:hypothetical protein
MEPQIDYLMVLGECGPGGASEATRRRIRDKLTVQANRGICSQDDDLVSGHLCEWLGGTQGPKTNLRLTGEGSVWAAAGHFAKQQGLTVRMLLQRQLSGLRLGTQRTDYLMMLSDYGPRGASAAERKHIRDTLFPHPGEGNAAQDDDLVNSHLCEWVGGGNGQSAHLRPTAEGALWAAAAHLAKQQGLSVRILLLKQLAILTQDS